VHDQQSQEACMLKDLSAVELMSSFNGFVSEGCGVVLNKRQLEAAGAILESVCRGEGSSFRLNFSHADQQALSTHLLAYLLRMYNQSEHSLLVIHPDPGKQVGAMDQLVECLWANIFTRSCLTRVGDDFVIGSCRARFYHAAEALLPVVSAPHLLVLVDQSRDIPAEVLDAQVSRLTTGGNSTRVLCGVSVAGNDLMQREPD